MKYFVFLLLLLSLMSCDNMMFFGEKILLGGAGYVYSTTNEPIDSVKVIIYHDNTVVDSTYSDSTGYYNGVKWKRCFFCPSVKFKFEKINYETKDFYTKEYYSNRINGRQPPYDSMMVVLAKKSKSK